MRRLNKVAALKPPLNSNDGRFFTFYVKMGKLKLVIVPYKREKKKANSEQRGYVRFFE